MELLTPRGTAGVAVVRVASAETTRVLAMLAGAGGTPLVARSTVPQRALLRGADGALDDVLVVARDGALELHLHGAPAVLEALHCTFGLADAAPASPAAALLRDALAPEQLDLAVEQLDVPFADTVRDFAPPERAAAIARSRAAIALAVPQRLVLAGRQNAGKSTLFNLLLFRERALTGPLPGLTRDPIAERTALAGYPYELIDTAGEGTAASAVDAAAIARGRELREGALLVLVVDGAVGPTAADRELAPRAAVVVASKADLAAAPWPPDVPCHAHVSAVAQDAAAIRSRVGELLRVHRGLPAAGVAGGVAALSPEQLEALARRDCGAPPGSA